MKKLKLASTVLLTTVLSSNALTQTIRGLEGACSNDDDPWNDGYCSGYFQAATIQLYLTANYINNYSCEEWDTISAAMVKAKFETLARRDETEKGKAAGPYITKIFAGMLECKYLKGEERASDENN